MSLKILDMIHPNSKLDRIGAERKFRKILLQWMAPLWAYCDHSENDQQIPCLKFSFRSDVRLSHYRLFLPQLGHFHSGGFPSEQMQESEVSVERKRAVSGWIDLIGPRAWISQRDAL